MAPPGASHAARGTPHIIARLLGSECPRSNYISKDPDPGFVNFALLEAVIKENPELWKKVRVKSV